MALPDSGQIADLQGSSQAVGSVRPLHVVPAGAEWTQTHLPAANVLATKTQPQAGSGLCNVCTAITVGFAADGTAPTAVNVSVKVLDGPTGSTRTLWGLTLSLPATAGASGGAIRENCWLKGSPNTPMTLEFSAAGGADTVESVSFEGVVVR